MATLSQERKKKVRKRRIVTSTFLVIISSILCPYICKIMSYLLEHKSVVGINCNYLEVVFTNWSQKELKLYLLIEVLVLVLIYAAIFNSWNILGTTDVKEIIPGIEIPIAVGQGQHGTSRFLTEQEKRQVYFGVCNNNGKLDCSNQNLGLIVEMVKKGKKEFILCIKDDIHSIIIGSTRSGKSRRLILETIWIRSLMKKSSIISDPKGELFLYSHKYLESQGIQTIAYDFRNPLKSAHYNYMQFINEAVDNGDIPRAIDYTWDLVSVMVGLPKGEPLWTNGESSVIAASILIIAIEAPKKMRNLTNVYYFLSNMCETDEFGQMPINEYLDALPDIHPAKGVFGIAKLSPSRTRGSFFGSALATLRLFTNWNIADMTSRSDYDVMSIGKIPTTVFIILPDEKTTFYSLASLMINQLYVKLVELANQSGGRVPCEVEFDLDEFGNFPEIPGCGGMLSAGAGRGLRFNLVLQDYQQLEKIYPKDFDNIKGNCQNTIYLRTPTLKTLEELSKRTGTYTVQVNSNTSSVSGNIYRNSSYSDNASMQSRPLLTADEVGRVDAPYALSLFAGHYPAIVHCPDLSEYIANTQFGMGDEEFNTKLLMDREREREEREREDMKLWPIWSQYKNGNEKQNDKRNERVSFL